MLQKGTTFDILNKINAETIGRSQTQGTMEFSTLLETSSPVLGIAGGSPMSQRGRRSVRTLPFSSETFRLITKGFFIHGSVARVVSRADVPVFSGVEVDMGEPDGPTYPSLGS